jgi:hypothetical protein
MLADMLGKAVFIACNAISTRFFVLEVVVLGVEQAFKFSDGRRKLNPVASWFMSAPIQRIQESCDIPTEWFIRLMSMPDSVSQARVVSDASACGANVLATRSAVQCFPDVGG